MKTFRPSSLARIMECAGYVGLAAQCGESGDSEAAKEGTAAHEAAELVLTGQAPDLDSLIDRQMSNGVFVNAEMADNLRLYVETVQGFEIERHASWQISDSATLAGTCDAVSVRGDTLCLYDLKYGWRIVEAVENWQLLAYAILNGGLSESIAKISMTIYQPRPWHPDGTFRTWIISREKLQEYARRITSRLTTLDDELQTGTHCRYCDALTQCPAARVAGYNAVDTIMHASTLEADTPERLTALLESLTVAQDRVKLLISSLEDSALARIQAGESLPGYRAEVSYGRRVWQDHVTPATVEAFTQRDDLTETTLVTPAQAKKKGVDTSVINALSHTPKRGYKLGRVTENDATRAFENASKG